jgi:TRAP-type C4-dicarboxylate transport system substrate-binding protein
MSGLRGLAFGLLCLSAGIAAPAHAQIHLKAVGPYDPGHVMTQSFKRFIDKVNQDGKGLVEIEYIGGPEVIPPEEQGNAVRSGFIDITEGPSSYYVGQVPGGEVILSYQNTPSDLRKNGATAILSAHWVKKLNAQLLAIPDSGLTNKLWLSREPKIAENGDLDLDGMKVRITPTGRAIVQHYNGVGISLSAGDVYSALQRNIVQGVGWPSVAVADADWHSFAKYRIDPGFLTGAYVMIFNHDKWESLPQNAKDLLTKVAAEWEVISRQFMAEQQAREDKDMRAQGMKVITLSPEAAKRYTDFAFDDSWGRLIKADPELAEALKDKVR